MTDPGDHDVPQNQLMLLHAGSCISSPLTPCTQPKAAHTSSCSNNKSVQQAEKPVNYCNPYAPRALLVVGLLWSLQAVMIPKHRYWPILNVLLGHQWSRRIHFGRDYFALLGHFKEITDNNYVFLIMII